MSVIRILPTCWFESPNWRSVQLFGRLSNGNTIYLRVENKPYFTVRYPDSIEESIIEESHSFLLTKMPIESIKRLSDRIYRLYTGSKSDYTDAITFYKRNGSGEIVDAKQSVKSKFFTDRGIFPGSWQEASNLQTLRSEYVYSKADLEFFTRDLVSIDQKGEKPTASVLFFDLEVVSTDRTSFPLATNPEDRIISISSLQLDRTGAKKTLYMLTPLTIDRREVRTFLTEKELIEAFLNDLSVLSPDYIVGYNSKRFDINYIGERVRLLKIRVPNISKIINHNSYFYSVNLIQRTPFFSKENVRAIRTPGISQIDLLDLFRRTMPKIGNHRLETVATLLLGRGKFTLPIPEMFAAYDSGTVEGIEKIADYSLEDSVLLKDLWLETDVQTTLLLTADFWKADAQHCLDTDGQPLFRDLIGWITFDPPPSDYRVDEEIDPPIPKGIYRDLYMNSMSRVYTEVIRRTGTELAIVIADYFANSSEGEVAFASGYFPVSYADAYQLAKDSTDSYLFRLDNDVVATKERVESLLKPEAFFPLMIVSGKSWLAVMKEGVVLKKGMSSFVRPPFKLIARYMDYIVKLLIDNPEMDMKTLNYPNLETTFDDYIMEMKITTDNYIAPPEAKREIVQQMKELQLPPPVIWRTVRYIKTLDGIVIEELYSRDVERWIERLDLAFYSERLRAAISSIS